MAPDDLPLPPLSGPDVVVIGRRLLHYPSVTSTQDVARDAGRSGEPEGLVVTAGQQTAGRGRLGRRWEAPPGSSLLLSVLLRPSPQAFPLISMAAGLATCLAIEDVTGLAARLKWPNDVLVHDRKVAGLLVESEALGESLDFAVLGIGVNVNLDPRDLGAVAYPAGSLSAEAGRPVDRTALARSLIAHLDRQYRLAGDGNAVLAGWKQRLATLGQRVQVFAGDVLEEGFAEDVDSGGALLLRRDDGALVRLPAGEVTSHPPGAD